MHWNRKEDTLTTAKLTSCPTTTKRGVLQAVSSVFDPIGLFTPVTLPAKLFIQHLWNKGQGWDKELTSEDQQQCTEILKELQLIEKIHIPRFIDTNNSATYKLLCFTDASKKAYAAAVYLLVTTNMNSTVHLVFSKSRLAPTKPLTIPRLELLGVLIGVRCLKFVETQLKLNIAPKILWTDSQCVLHWLNSNKPLSVFVEKRLKEIKSHDITFKYITTEENPADLPTRGTTAAELENCLLWWKGPQWLTNTQCTWPIWSIDEVTSDVLNSESKKNKVMYEVSLISENEATVTDIPLGIKEERFSSISRLLRVTALALRFINRLKHNVKQTGAITALELQKARSLWGQRIQRRTFHKVIEDLKANKRNNLITQLGLQIDSEGLLRCYGRFSSFFHFISFISSLFIGYYSYS